MLIGTQGSMTQALCVHSGHMYSILTILKTSIILNTHLYSIFKYTQYSLILDTYIILDTHICSILRYTQYFKTQTLRINT
jgi:hypothetical protein